MQALQTQVASQQSTIAALQTQVARQPRSVAPTPTPKPAPGQITQFGQTSTISGAVTDKDGKTKFVRWKVTIDGNVEGRDHIGDYSIVPKRGQFLVTWLTFETDNHEVFRMGNVSLKAGPAGQLSQTYDFTHEGTAALWVTEANFNADLLDNGTPCRTGIVFDIRPEDTHFDLIYDTGGKPYPIDIVFDA